MYMEAQMFLTKFARSKAFKYASMKLCFSLLDAGPIPAASTKAAYDEYP